MMLYATPHDTPLPVERDGNSYKLLTPQGERVFPSARQLLIAITGHPAGRNWTFDRYFRLGKWATRDVYAPNQAAITVIELFGGRPYPYDESIVVDDFPSTIHITESLLTIDESLPKKDVEENLLGIDLAKRHDEVAKLLFAGFGKRIFAAGYDPQDVLQEVFKGLLTRNAGTCPWDPRKSSFGHYVHMVCGCVLANYHKRMQRRRAVEQVGVKGWRDGSLREGDAGSSETLTKDPQAGTSYSDLEDYLLARVGHLREGRYALLVARLLGTGHTRTEIAGRLGISKATVNRVVRLIQEVAGGWVRGN